MSKKLKFKKIFNNNLLIVFISVFAVAGTVSLLSSQAAPAPNGKSSEAESSITALNTSIVADSTASGGSYLSFNNAPTQGVTQFFEDFTTDQRNRFDWRLTTTNEPPRNSFLGDHDNSTPCNGPTTYRTVNQIPLQWGVKHTNVDIVNSEMVWWCAPGNDTAKGHMMTALDTESIAAMAFSPKQILTDVIKVCYDQNMTNLGEGKWLNIFIVPAAHVAANNGDINYLAGSGVPFGGIDQRLPPGAVDFTWLRGSIGSHKILPDGSYDEQFSQWMSIDPTDTNGDGVVGPGDAPTRGMGADPAPRFKVCIDDGTNKVVIQRPNGTTDTYDYSVAFPAGQVRVIFQDASYNPTKHNGADNHLTWHWDNISIE